MDFAKIFADTTGFYKNTIKDVKHFANWFIVNSQESVDNAFDCFYSDAGLQVPAMRTVNEFTLHECSAGQARRIIREGMKLANQIERTSDAVEIREDFDFVFSCAVDALYPKPATLPKDMHTETIELTKEQDEFIQKLTTTAPAIKTGEDGLLLNTRKP